MSNGDPGLVSPGRQLIPWICEFKTLYILCRALRQQDEGNAEKALKSSRMVIPEIRPKAKSPELLARLAKLQRQEDDRKYNAMVADITKAVRSLPSHPRRCCAG